MKKHVFFLLALASTGQAAEQATTYACEEISSGTYQDFVEDEREWIFAPTVGGQSLMKIEIAGENGTATNGGTNSALRCQSHNSNGSIEHVCNLLSGSGEDRPSYFLLNTQTKVLRVANLLDDDSIQIHAFQCIY